MDSSAAAAPGQGDKASSQTKPQANQPANTGQAAPAPAPAPAPDANAIPHGDLSNLPMQTGLPADLNSFMMPQDGSMLGPDALMNMPMMMPMMMGGMDGSMDSNGLLNMPQMPQNGISNGKFLHHWNFVEVRMLKRVQMRSRSTTDKFASGACRRNRKYVTRTCCSSP